ncbi:hypothetical protein OROMI_014603 [Orobanche minor]
MEPILYFGNKVGAMLYRTDVDLFKNNLSPNESYLIKRCCTACQSGIQESFGR